MDEGEGGTQHVDVPRERADTSRGGLVASLALTATQSRALAQASKSSKRPVGALGQRARLAASRFEADRLKLHASHRLGGSVPLSATQLECALSTPGLKCKLLRLVKLSNTKKAVVTAECLLIYPPRADPPRVRICMHRSLFQHACAGSMHFLALAPWVEMNGSLLSGRAQAVESTRAPLAPR